MEEEKLKDCTISPSIKVGHKIPDEIAFRYDGGSGWTNMGSWIMDHRFKKFLKQFQEDEYIFSDICRNENEKKAFELAIEENCLDIGYRVVKYIG